MTRTLVGPFRGPVPSDVMKKVSEVVPRLQITDIRLVGLNCQLKALPQLDRAVNVELNNEAKADPVEDDVLGIQIRFILNAKNEGDDTKDFLTLTATFQLTYEGENVKEIAEDSRIAFANVNAVYNAWPYLRELVQNISSRMSIPPLTVPLLKVKSLEKKDSGKATVASKAPKK